MSKLSKYEQETIINFNVAEKFAEVYTADPNIIRKLDALVEKYPDHYKLVKQDDVAKYYEVASKKLIQFRPPRVLSEEQKKELTERMQRINNNKLA